MVDFGPLSLPVGEVPWFQAADHGLVSHGDVEKLQRLLSGEQREGQRKENEVSDLPFVISCHKTRHQTQVLTALAELLPQLGRAANTEKSTAKIKIHNGLLANTQLSVTDTGARIEFVFLVGEHEDRRWLQQRISWLAKIVGESLQRNVRVSAPDTEADLADYFSADWFVGMGA